MYFFLHFSYHGLERCFFFFYVSFDDSIFGFVLIFDDSEVGFVGYGVVGLFCVGLFCVGLFCVGLLLCGGGGGFHGFEADGDLENIGKKAGAFFEDLVGDFVGGTVFNVFEVLDAFD